MKNKNPLISILMNCYNGEAFLREAIESIFAQTYTNWELIFWDNQSTDNSAHICKSYNDPRIKYYYAPEHKFLYGARNDAIKYTQGEFIAFLDTDDLWTSNKLEQQIQSFDDPDVGISCSNYYLLYQKSKQQKPCFNKNKPSGYVTNQLLLDYYIGLLSAIVRKSVIQKEELYFDSRYNIIGDFDLFIRMSFHCKVDYIHEPLAYYRIHGDNLTTRSGERQIQELDIWNDEMIEQYKLNSLPSYNEYFGKFLYSKAFYYLSRKEKRIASDIFFQMPAGKYKLRLLMILLLPYWLFQKLSNV